MNHSGDPGLLMSSLTVCCEFGLNWTAAHFLHRTPLGETTGLRSCDARAEWGLFGEGCGLSSGSFS